MNQDDRTTGAFDYEMKTRAVDSHEFRARLRIVVSDARSDIALLESSGYFHDWCSSLSASADVSGSRTLLTTETERHKVSEGEIFVRPGETTLTQIIDLSTSQV